MEIIEKKYIEKFSLPLRIYKMAYVADAIGKSGEEFSIFVGLDEKLVAELTRYSEDLSDTELQKNTPDKERFARGAYEDWYKKIRTPFAFVHKKTDVLAALVWLGPRPLDDKEGNWHTVGWRSYNPWRGKGVMKDFANFAINFYLKHFPDVKLWITAKEENTASLHLAENLGFKRIKYVREKGFFEMIKDATI